MFFSYPVVGIPPTIQRGEKEMKTNRTWLALTALVVVAMLLSSCGGAAPAAPAATAVPAAPAATAVPAAPAAPTAAAAVAPTAVPPTPPPPVCEKMANPPTVKAGELGSAGKPIVITFVPSGDTGKITKAGNAIADCLNKMTGLTYQIQVGTSFGASIEALGANKAQVGFLNTFSALLAQTKYGITPILAVLRKYSTNAVDPDSAMKGKIEPFYKGQFIANQASGVKSFADLKGKTFCFVDPNSTSGYIIPRIVLKANGIDPDKDLKASVNAGSHPNVVTAVYKGDCDAGVTYIDAITDPVANLPAKYPDLTTKVTAFADTDRIPNDGVQVVKDLPAPIVQATTDGLLAMAKDPGGNAVLRGLYTIDGFEKIDATFYQPFLDLLKKAGVDPAALVK
jgi:phosphonate transport system substrate-binding protein